MASEEQYLDDLLKSMMDNKPDSMEDAMQDMNKAENKPSDFSTEDLNSMLDELEQIRSVKQLLKIRRKRLSRKLLKSRRMKIPMILDGNP